MTFGVNQVFRICQAERLLDVCLEKRLQISGVIVYLL